jgi:hypothetical protein
MLAVVVATRIKAATTPAIAVAAGIRTEKRRGEWGRLVCAVSCHGRVDHVD